MRNVLVTDPFEHNLRFVEKCLAENNFEVDVAKNGKDAQLKCYQKKYFAVFIDLDTTNHSGIEVLKYLRTKNTTGVKVVITIESDKRMKELELSKEDLLKLGVDAVVVKPYTEISIMNAISDKSSFEFGKDSLSCNQNTGVDNVEITARDDLFTRVSVNDFFSGSTAIFDLYVRIHPNRYLKILHKGDCFTLQHISNYLKKSEHLYFRTKDRSTYIQYLNLVAERLMKKTSSSLLSSKVKIVGGATEKFIEEIYTEGIKPELVETGEKVCRNVLDLIKKEKDLYKIVRNMKDTDGSIYSHSLLVVFFSCMICNKMEWSTYPTIRKVSLGSILHDIGKVKLDPFVKTMLPEDMNVQQYKNYVQHPELGVEILQRYDWIPVEVRQIVMQHHETMDGEGFSRGLSGLKIFPLAQIVGFSNKIANIMKRQQISPLKAIKTLLAGNEDVSKYNQQVVKSFIKCLINSDLDF